MIHVGTSGWSYPTGQGRWEGVFYPRGRKVDHLEFYANYFDTVEINSSFYRPILPNVAKSWVQKTPAAFRFAAKLYQKFTHPKMFEEATISGAQVGDAAAADPAGMAGGRRGPAPWLRPSCY